MLVTWYNQRERTALELCAGTSDSVNACRYTGAGALGFLQRVLPASLSSLPVPQKEGDSFKSTLSVLLNEEGGIIDDCMVTRWGKDSFVPVLSLSPRRAALI